MSLKYFITGTDTGVGKTHVSVRLLKAYQQIGRTTLGIKPIASGCANDQGKLRHDDAIALQQASTIKLPYDQINPYAFAPAIAPHIAAQQTQCALTVATLTDKLQFALQYPADICIIEGAGGWHVPLNDHETMADFVRANQLPVILVVSIRLGCLNHAILTANAIQQDHLTLAGWVANCIEPDVTCRDENIETLAGWIKAPLLDMTSDY